MSVTNDYSRFIEQELSLWIEKELEAVDTNVADTNERLKNLEQEETRLKLFLDVCERRRKALYDLAVGMDGRHESSNPLKAPRLPQDRTTGCA